MRKTTVPADRLSDLEITTCILRRSPARSSSRSCSRSSTWWSSTAAIAAGVLLVLGLSAAAACDDSNDPELATCEEYGEKVHDCHEDLDAAGVAETCEEDLAAGHPLFECYLACDLDTDCDNFQCCTDACAGSPC